MTWKGWSVGSRNSWRWMFSTGETPVLLGNPARGYVAFLTLLLFQQLCVRDTLFKNSEALAAGFDLDGVVRVGLQGHLARQWTAGMERATGRGIGGRRHFAFEHDALLGRTRVGFGDGGE